MIDSIEESIYRDEGALPMEAVNDLELSINVHLPTPYIGFVTKHNEARIIANCFDFYDNNRKKNSGESIAFLNLLQIKDDMDSLLEISTDDPDDPDIHKFYHYFSKWLIPFGETGGGDFICFDYRNDKNTTTPPIVFWCHDAYSEEGRVSFIANNFEEFINMLHEPED